MPDLRPNLPIEGGCRCGQVRFKVSAPPLLTMACHCAGCQRMTASAFSLSAAIPGEGFTVTRGEPVIGGLHGDDTHHYFCPHCMSWLFTKAEGMDWFVNIRTPMLDEPAWAQPFIETWTREALPWVHLPVTHSFEEFPPFDAYERLVAAYQAQGAG
jgi:hypothetical protein